MTNFSPIFKMLCGFQICMTLSISCGLKHHSTYKTQMYAPIDTQVIQQEIALFSFKGSKILGVDSLCKVKLDALPVVYCNDTLVNFERIGKITSISKYVAIAIRDFDTLSRNLTHCGSKLCLINGKKFWGTNGSTPKKYIRLLSIYHVNAPILLPDSAINDLYEPNTCINIPIPNSKKFRIESSCKVFLSKDRRRLYIYMRNGADNARYEVTWIVISNKVSWKDDQRYK